MGGAGGICFAPRASLGARSCEGARCIVVRHARERRHDMAGIAGESAEAPRTRTAVRRSGGTDRGANVGDMERIASVAAGGALAAYALKRKDLPGIVAGVIGGLLVERGVTGHCHVYGALGMTSAESSEPVKRHGPNAVLDASDATRVERAVTVY